MQPSWENNLQTSGGPSWTQSISFFTRSSSRCQQYFQCSSGNDRSSPSSLSWFILSPWRMRRDYWGSVKYALRLAQTRQRHSTLLFNFIVSKAPTSTRNVSTEGGSVLFLCLYNRCPSCCCFFKSTVSVRSVEYHGGCSHKRCPVTSCYYKLTLETKMAENSCVGTSRVLVTRRTWVPLPHVDDNVY